MHQDDLAISALRAHVLLNDLATAAMLLTEARKPIAGRAPGNDELLAAALDKTTRAAEELQRLMQGAPADTRSG